jgi:putative DNA primase/helicase
MQTQNNNTVVAPVSNSSITAIPAATAQIVESIFDLKRIKNRPSVDTSIGLDLIIDAAIKALVDTQLVFDRCSILVCIDRDNSMHQLKPATVRLVLARLIEFTETKFIRGREETVPVPPPAYIGETICAMTKWPDMPIVESVSDHPFVTADGNIIGIGYDMKTRNFGRFDLTKFNVIENPTEEDAATALLVVQRLLQSFSFETAFDEAAAIAAMLAAVARPAVDTSLLVLIDAAMSGSGKGYLGELFARLAHDKHYAANQLPNDEAELHKSLMSELIAASPVCFFDEVAVADIDSQCLRTFISAPVYGGRFLGFQRKISFPNKTFTLATANNCSATADMARRTLNIRLDPKCENPSARRFEYKAHLDMQANRALFVSSLMTIQKAFLLAQQRGEITHPQHVIGGFDEWETLCRLPVIWLTGIDPCHKTFETMKSNSAKNELLVIIAAWVDAFGDKAIKAGDALKNENFAACCEENIKRKPGSHVNSISFGIWLKKHKGSVTQNKRFHDDAVDSKTGSVYWKVISEI